MPPRTSVRILRLLPAWLLVSFLTWGVASPSPLVRVLLDEVRGPVSLRIDGAHRGYVDGQLRFSTAFGLEWPLAVEAGRLVSDGRVLGASFELEPLEGTLRWAGRSYRGNLRVVASARSLLVINVVALEDYLRGVVPSEMQAVWPLEALKAQAVASRTYTLASLDPAAPYDVCANDDCQVYEGAGAEHPRSDRAVQETQGIVLTYGNAFARTYYHADSGGVVASSAEVWGTAFPYLISRPDVSLQSPHSTWEYRLDPAVIAASLGRLGRSVGEVRSLRVLTLSESGRVLEVEVAGALGRIGLGGVILRNLLREWGLKSTRFSMVGSLLARGSGWGHGVGMSQYGARALATTAYSYGQILAFYYPNTRLQILPYAQ